MGLNSGKDNKFISNKPAITFQSPNNGAKFGQKFDEKVKQTGVYKYAEGYNNTVCIVLYV